jgi:hypothetical protein
MYSNGSLKTYYPAKAWIKKLNKLFFASSDEEKESKEFKFSSTE